MSDHPPQWDELTPEQQATLVEFGRHLVEHMQAMADAMQRFAAAAAEAARQIEAARTAWGLETDPPEPGDSP